MAPRRLTFAGPPFEALHRRRLGPAPDLTGLDLAARNVTPALLEQGRAIWRQRALTEFRSIQIMTRFLTEVTGAGDPLDVYAGALELVEDEIRHAEMCAAVCKALGTVALLPEPVALVDPPEYVNSPMAERALATAISMLGINETISVGYIDDLAARCPQPALRRVLQATRGDEVGHQDFGWGYIRQSLRRFPESTLADWRHLVSLTLAPHQAVAARLLEQMPADKRQLEAWPEPELVELGLHSPERQALLFRRTLTDVLEPRLRELRLLD